MQTYHGSIYHSQGIGQASKTEKERTIWQKEKVHQAWSKCYGSETDQKGSETEKKEASWGTTCIQENECLSFWLCTVPPVKKAKIENWAQANYTILIIIIVG